MRGGHSPKLALVHSFMFGEVCAPTERLLAVLALERLGATVCNDVRLQLVCTTKRAVTT